MFFVREKIDLCYDKVFYISDIGTRAEFNEGIYILIGEVFFCVVVCMNMVLGYDKMFMLLLLVLSPVHAVL